MAGQHNPLSQFDIKPLLSLKLGSIDLSFTNSSLFMLIATILSATILILPMRNARLIPNRMQNVAELLYQFVSDTIVGATGEEGKKYFPFVFSLFLFILVCNLLGMLPYSFTVTSHIVVTFALASLVFLVVTAIAFMRHGLHFFAFFLPQGTPLWLAPLMVLIELFTYLARPISLSIRLAANMVAGHILLKVLAGFILMMGALWGWIPIPFIVIMTGFEIFVAILQAYIFTILTCVYLNDAINMH